MMMMSVVTFREQLEARGTITEIKALHHAHRFEEVHRAINRGEVAISISKFFEDFTNRHGAVPSAKNVEDGLARAGDFVRLAAETRRQFGQGRVIRRAAGMGVSLGLHAEEALFNEAARPDRNRDHTSVAVKMVMQVSTMVAPHGTLSR